LPNQVFTTVISFNGSNGALPSGALVEGRDGSIYGVAQQGGQLQRCSGGCGTVFRLSDGKLSTLFRFTGNNGARPQGGLWLDKEDLLWGTTAQGGSMNAGVVFTVSPARKKLEKIHIFKIFDGASPNGGLVQTRDGTFYGTTQTGGDYGQGTIFKITSDRKVESIFSFSGQEGANPRSGLIEGRDGALYGTTLNGAPNQPGMIYRLSVTGVVTPLTVFNGKNGAKPYGGLSQGKDSKLYGTTAEGGKFNNGTIFRVN
jgi:uncharacterized repeat protein (TIGR03803 family)